MRTIDLKEAQERIGQLLTTLDGDGPIKVQSQGKDVAVLLSPALLETLLKQPPDGVSPKVAALFKKSLLDRWQVYASLRQYELDHPED